MFNNFSGSLVLDDDALQLGQRLAADCAQWLQDAIEQRGQATLVVSGGSTPTPFFESLSKQGIVWDKVQITLADERWVAADNAISNEKLVREQLMCNAASAATFASLYSPADTPDEAWSKCEATLSKLIRPFDVVVLGMGDDGHTASLFPNAESLAEACDMSSGRLCWPMHPDHLTESRMTLTLPALLACHNLVLHIVGDKKRAVFQQALDGAELPIAKVADSASERLTVYWADW